LKKREVRNAKKRAGFAALGLTVGVRGAYKGLDEL
jgi:hypothetical protein